MFLEKLKIKGFKSFARGLTVDFNSPITTIVGPNGSGKSNIVDAIRWVLGEQSAKTLRGSKMSDVIFAGSVSHKPMNKARVTLYLNNKNDILSIDDDRVKIAREVNKEGESDYILNGSICRLKDIKKLLMDTGLGTDSYSIVGQGQITSILNSKPQKLREFFEEAAGISKHKARKQEAEKRLEKTNQKLQRIKDLIRELEKQLSLLETSAQKAKKYKHLKNELSSLEINLLLDNWEKYDTELSKVKSDKLFLKNKLEEKDNQYNKQNNKLKKEKEELEKKENYLSTKRDNFYRLKTKKEEVNNKLNLLTEKRKGLIREKDSLFNHLDELKDNKQQLSSKKNNTLINFEKVKKEEKELEQKLLIKKDKFKTQEKKLRDKKEQLSSLQEHVMDDDGELKGLNTEVEKYKEKIKFNRNRIEDLSEQKRNFIIELEEKISHKKRVQSKLNELKREELDLEKKLKQYRQEASQQKEKLIQFKNDYEQLTDRLKQKKSRLTLLQDMENDYEGYYRGVKNILKNKNKFSGLIGVVADLFEVEEKYEQAIETVLGAKLQNIIVKDDHTARKGIKYLKKNKYGRATFLPLNMVKGREVNINKLGVKGIDGFLGLASDMVSCKSNLKKIKKYLLGRILVASNIDSGSKIAKTINSRLRIVSLDGDLINPGGAMTGGSSKNNNRGLLRRSRKIEKLKKDIDKLEKDIEIKKSKGLKIKNRAEAVEENIKKMQDCLHQLELKKNNIINDLNNIKKENKQIRSRLIQSKQEINELKDEISNFKDAKNELKEKITLINNNYSRDKGKIEDWNKELNNIEERKEHISQEVTDLKVELASTVQKRENSSDKLNNFQETIADNDNKIISTKNKVEEVEQKIKQIKEQKRELKEQKERLKTRLQKLNNECEQLNLAINKKKETVSKLEDKEEILRKEVNKLKDQLHKIDLKISRLENKKERNKEKLNEEYEIEPGEDNVERINITNYKGIEKKIKELKNAINKLKPINLGAIEEFEELKERVEYLQSQEQDLIEAQNSIKKIITEIENKMGNLFFSTFKEVKGEFDSVFKKLFDGGKAKLKLVEPDNLLTTGVEISAQPPGKQLKKLSLMSGGERALTAIALVFAFLKVNPSPIYILDEIDAPLDDANVVRFARFIRKYSQYAQFIVITHRKDMMTRADTIYGITMEESGISKLVSLRMNDNIPYQNAK